MNNYPLRSKKRTEGQILDLTEDSDDGIAVKPSIKKSLRRRQSSSKTKPNKDDGNSAPTMKPDNVRSFSSNNNSSAISFDEDDFEELRQRYLMPRIQKNAELPTGMTLRKTCKPRLIDLKTPGFKRLRVRIDELIKKDETLKVYRLLCQVRDYEIDPKRVPMVMQEANQDGDIQEIFDLTQDTDDCDSKECFNVDEYITDVLLPQNGAVSRPDCVTSASFKGGKEDNVSPIKTKNEVHESKSDKDLVRSSSPKTIHHIAQVTPEKCLRSASNALSSLVSDTTSRSSTPSVDLSIEGEMNCKMVKREQECNRLGSFEPKLYMKIRTDTIDQVYLLKGRDKALAKRNSIRLGSKVGNRSRDELRTQRNVCVFNVPMTRPPRLLIHDKPSGQLSLANEWRSQIRRRRQGAWVPSGHITGRWKQPAWAKHSDNDSPSILPPKKPSSCKKSLLPILHSLVVAYLKLASPSVHIKKCFISLQNVICPTYLNPTQELLRHAHRALCDLLPDGDCEEFDVIKLARAYYDYWRPDQVKVILLAESHAHTEKSRAFNGPKFDNAFLEDYDGPCDFLSLVYCLAYGENEALIPSMNDKRNKGTTQFWTLFAAVARGVDYVAPSKSGKAFASPFAADILKGGGLPVGERLKAKLNILRDLKRRGIWLLDVSIFGWYISQPQQYTRSSTSNEIHRRPKARPPLHLKAPSLVLSWEMYTKHLIRQVAEEGHLKLLIPIGMEVDLAITRLRMNEAISVCEGAKVTDTMPAPNAWIPGGYGPFHAKLQKLVEQATPR